MNLHMFGVSVFACSSVADSDLFCVLLACYVTWTKSTHAILKTQNKLKLSSSSPPPATFRTFFSLCELGVLYASRAQWNTALLDIRQNRTRCFVVTHMPWTKDKKTCLFPLSSRPSAQGVKVWWSWVKSSKGVQVFLCVILGVIWCNAEQRHWTCVTLKLSKKKKCHESASCWELFTAVLQTGWLYSWKTGHILPDMRDTKWGCAARALQDRRLDRSFEPLPMNTGRTSYERSFMQVPTYR